MGLLSSPAWTRKEGKNPKGGLNAKGRASYNKGRTKTGKKRNLKPPAPKPPPKPYAPKAAKPILPIGLLTIFLIGLVIFLTKLPNPYNCLGSCILDIVII